MNTRTLPTVAIKNISVAADDSCAASISPPPAISALLLAALQRALSNPRNLPAACQSLDLFIALVRAHAGRSIPVARASQLITDALRIKAVLGCHC